MTSTASAWWPTSAWPRRAFEGESSVQIALRHINDTPEPLPADVPDAVRQLVERTLVKDPDERFPDGAALLSAVEDILAGRDLSPQPDRLATTVLPVPDAGGRAGARAARPCGSRHVARPEARSLRRPTVPPAARRAGRAAGRHGGRGGPARVASRPLTGAGGRAHVRADVEHDRPSACRGLPGRPVAEVEAELTGLGLSVQLRPVQTADAPAGQVLAVEPLEELTPGQTVTVTYAVAPVPAPAVDAGGAGTEEPDTGSTPTAPTARPRRRDQHGARRRRKRPRQRTGQRPRQRLSPPGSGRVRSAATGSGRGRSRGRWGGG